jgi:hypothetical protein
MKTLAIKSLTGTPQAKVLSKYHNARSYERRVLAFLERKEHARRAEQPPSFIAKRAELIICEHYNFLSPHK